jgi:hypothetical protein
MSLRGIDVQHKYHHPSPTVRLDPDSKNDQLLSQDVYEITPHAQFCLLWNSAIPKTLLGADIYGV